jgi:hypothetical protein
MTTALELSKFRGKKPKRRNLWFERIMAFLALSNLILVIFDLTYLPLRDFYLKRLPWLVEQYDPIKAIEPHRDTQEYLDTVEELEATVAEEGLQSEAVEPTLAELREQSEVMIDENPFQLADKIGTLERIKNRMRDRVPNEQDSSKEAFRTFWSQEYLLEAGWQDEIIFFNEEIEPLIATNYYRPYSETGDFVNYFWWIDLPFVIIFAVEFLGRTYYIHRTHSGLSWFDAMTWRWYDVFLFIPFAALYIPYWALLRIIPVLIRNNQADLIELRPIQKQISQGFVANIAEDMTEVVLVRVINQVQSAIAKGEISQWLTQRNVKTYVDINDVNETVALTQLFLRLLIEEVFPTVKPDVEALLHHNLEKALNQSDAYRGLQRLPGVASLENNLTHRLSKEVTEALYTAMQSTLKPDPVGDELTQRLVEHTGAAFSTQLQANKTLEQIQYLVDALLEEVKINYVKRLSQEDVEDILEQTRALRENARTDRSSVKVIK